MLISYQRGQGSIVLRVKILDSAASTGAGKTGLTSSSSGLIISTIADNEASATVYTQAGSTIETISTLGTYAAPTATKCRFKEVDSTNHKGIYEIQIADARFAVSSAKSLLISISGVTDAAETDALIPLTDFNPYDAVHGGLSALPNTACTTNASLITSGTGTAQLSVSGGAVKTQSAVKKNAALAGFEFLLIQSADHISPKTGATVTAQRSIDGAAFGSCTNSVAEVANGIYKISLSAGDLNGDTITLQFTASGADARFITILTTP